MIVVNVTWGAFQLYSWREQFYNKNSLKLANQKPYIEPYTIQFPLEKCEKTNNGYKTINRILNNKQHERLKNLVELMCKGKRELQKGKDNLSFPRTVKWNACITHKGEVYIWFVAHYLPVACATGKVSRFYLATRISLEFRL